MREVTMAQPTRSRPCQIKAALFGFLLIGGCAGDGGVGPAGFGIGNYALVRPQAKNVARGSMTVMPTIPWNRVPRGQWDISRQERWTLNGPLLDDLTFMGGLKHGERIVRERYKADRQVPRFRSDMSPPEIASMIESLYRINGGATEFTVTSMKPRTFLANPGFQLDFDWVGGDEVRRTGRAVSAVIGGKLYLALFDAARMHYFAAGEGEFERIVETARLKQ
jgi:hypothetical protein